MLTEKKINKQNFEFILKWKILNDFSWTVKMLFVVFLCQNSYFLVFIFIFLRFISCSTAKETNIAGQNKGKNNKKKKFIYVV